MSNLEKSTGSSEEKIKKLNEVSKKEIEEAESESKIDDAELSSFVEKGLSEEKILQPSHESLMAIEKGDNFLSDKQREILKIQAYFYEKFVNKSSQIMSGKRVEMKNTLEDLKDIENVINELSLKYEDISLLDRKKEYPAARKVIDEIRDYILDIKESRISPQPITMIWTNISNRVEDINSIFLLNGVEDKEAIKIISGLLMTLKQSINDRLPKIVKDFGKK